MMGFFVTSCPFRLTLFHSNYSITMKIVLFMTIGFTLAMLLCVFHPFQKNNTVLADIEQQYNLQKDKDTFAAFSPLHELDEPSQLMFSLKNIDDERFHSSEGNAVSLHQLHDRCELRVDILGESGSAQLRYFFQDDRLLSAQKNTFYHHNVGLANSRSRHSVNHKESYSNEVFNPNSERVIYEFESALRHVPEQHLQACKDFASAVTTASVT